MDLLSSRSPSGRYGLALLAVSVACLFNYLLWPYMHGAYFMLYLAAAILAALHGGWKPALLVIVLSTAKVMYFQLEPTESFAIDSPVDRIRLGIFLGLSAIVIFVCERLRLAHHELERSFRESEFLRKRYKDVLFIVSHELRNPLSTILLNATLVKRRASRQGDDSSAPLVKQANLITDSGERMNALIDDVVRLAKVETGTLALERETFPIQALIDATIDPLRSAAERKRLRLSVRVEDGSVEADWDHDAMRRALSALVNNAIRFTPEGGLIRVNVHEHDGRIQIFIQDSGQGMSPEQLTHAFDRYWQASHSPPGRGLGLLVAQGIVAAHGGTLRVRNQPGSGARFCLNIPKRRPELALTQAA